MLGVKFSDFRYYNDEFQQHIAEGFDFEIVIFNTIAIGEKISKYEILKGSNPYNLSKKSH